MPKKRKSGDLDDEDWRQLRAKIRGTGEGSISPRVNADQIIELFSPGIKGAYVNNERCCVKGMWESVGIRQGSLIINHLIDAIYMIAKAFCPQDANRLVTALYHSILGDVAVVNGGAKTYTDWSKQRLVQLLLAEFQKSKKGDRRKKILSWIAATSIKRKWIAQLFGVSHASIRTALRHANVWLPGGEKVRLSLCKRSYRPSARAVFLKKWIQDNIEHDPAGIKGKKSRLLPRNSGYNLYVQDAKLAGCPGGKPYSRSRFYSHPLQKGICNSKCRAGLCSNCFRYGTYVFDCLEQQAIEIATLMKPVLHFDIKKWKKSFNRVKKYFQRHGMFQRNLKMSCTNIHHCLSFCLSHPTNSMYQHKCEHEHTEVDNVCLLRDRLWKELYDFIDGTLSSQDDRVVRLLETTGLVGELVDTTISKKLTNIRKNLQNLHTGHEKYVGHLMLDSAQTKKLLQLRSQVSFTYTKVHIHIHRVHIHRETTVTPPVRSPLGLEEKLVAIHRLYDEASSAHGE